MSEELNNSHTVSANSSDNGSASWHSVRDDDGSKLGLRATASDDEKIREFLDVFSEMKRKPGIVLFSSMVISLQIFDAAGQFQDNHFRDFLVDIAEKACLQGSRRW